MGNTEHSWWKKAVSDLKWNKNTENIVKDANMNKIWDLFKVKLYTIRSETKKKRERARERKVRNRERKKRERENETLNIY